MPDSLTFDATTPIPRTLTREERQARTRARQAKERLEMIAAARRYAASDRSDPFALSRALSHIESGVSSYRRPESREWDIADRSAGFYDASPHRELKTVKTPTGETKIEAVSFRGMARP